MNSLIRVCLKNRHGAAAREFGGGPFSGGRLACLMIARRHRHARRATRIARDAFNRRSRESVLSKSRPDSSLGFNRFHTFSTIKSKNLRTEHLNAIESPRVAGQVRLVTPLHDIIAMPLDE